MSYVKAQLGKLKEINPQVSFDPLRTRSHPYQVGTRKNQTPVQDVCPDCAAIGITHSGQC